MNGYGGNKEMGKRIVIINKSDSTGGAAVVSRRLMEALRAEGADARMLVVEKLTNSPYVELAASPLAIKCRFIIERLKIFLANGFNRSTLFKIDTASDGLPLWKHPLVKDADAILLNWVNQGMLSLKGVRKILKLGKPTAWTMHDMWCMTGVCHHAGRCQRFLEECGDCYLLGSFSSQNDISHTTFKRKSELYGDLTSLEKGESVQEGNKIKFVAVSNWLADKGRKSKLLGNQNLSVIPNAFQIKDFNVNEEQGDSIQGRDSRKIILLFGAARIDDPIKNLPALIEMTKILGSDYPELALRLELVTFGHIKNPAAAEGIAIPYRHLGMISGEDAVKKIYESADILVSSSSYETLPGTLVEAQAYGCIPVSFDQGGQRDIVEHLSTGYIAKYEKDPFCGGRNLAEGIAWAVEILDNGQKRKDMLLKMRENVERRFSARAVAQAYLKLLFEEP